MDRVKEFWLRATIEAVNLLSPTIIGFTIIVIGYAGALFSKHADVSIFNQMITGGFALITGGKLQEARQLQRGVESDATNATTVKPS